LVEGLRTEDFITPILSLPPGEADERLEPGDGKFLTE
jgi:hypothetical protein